MRQFFIDLESENSEQESKMKIGKIVEDFENNQQMGPNIILIKVEQGYDEDAQQAKTYIIGGYASHGWRVSVNSDNLKGKD